MNCPVVWGATLLALIGSAGCSLSATELERLLADDWIPYGYNLYKLGADEATWDEARTTCPQMHERAYLTSVHSMGEQDFLASHFTSMATNTSIWIGLNDITDEGYFSWVNGDAVDFTYWGSGQPDDAGSGQDCARISTEFSLQWDDGSCGSHHKFVCKLEP